MHGAAFHARPVKRITQDRMADMRHMHAYLVGASGFQTAFHQTDLSLGKAGRAAIMRHCMACRRAFRYGDFLAIIGTARQRGIHRAGGGQRRAPNQRLIQALHAPVAAMRGKLLGEPIMRFVRFGDDHNAAGILVEAMHNARAFFAANAGQAVAAMRQ